jgi:UMF1 family MFS transporter
MSNIIEQNNREPKAKDERMASGAENTGAGIKPSGGKHTIQEVISWVSYNFGNAGFPAVVAAAIFNAYFVETVCGGANIPKGEATLLWTLAVGLSNFLVVVSAPILGALCDWGGAKRKVLILATLFCVTCTALLYFALPGTVTFTFALITLSYFAFSTGENIIASFLPDICEPENMGKVSGMGGMISHLGGLLVLGGCLAYVQYAKTLSQLPQQYVPVLVLFVAVVYAIFAAPSFFYLKEHRQARPLPAGQNYLSLGFGRVASTLKQTTHFQDLLRLLTTILSYTCGTSTVVVLAAVYAKEVMGFTMSDNITMFMVINLTATGGAYLFGYIQDKIGSKNTLMIALATWLISILVLYSSADKLVFWIAASLLGAANGGTFVAGRAAVGQFAPAGRAGEFFGLWGLSCKFAAIIGPICYGIIAYLSHGDHRLAILSTAAFFGIALVLAFTINDKRGRQAALSYSE